MSSPAMKFCAVCSGPLDFLELQGDPGGRYVHAHEEFGKRTHVAVPVDLPEISEVSDHCDFCFASGQMPWSVVTRPFKTETFVTEGGRSESYVQNYSSIWATCEDCANLIRRRRWSGLISRVVAEYRKREKFTSDLEKTMLKASLSHLFNLVEVNFVSLRESSSMDYADQIHAPDLED